MATEIAFLMERAYNAETERGLSVIRYDYEHTASGNLMGADLLLADIDFFTHDYVTTTKTRKIPVKQTISLADCLPDPVPRAAVDGQLQVRDERLPTSIAGTRACTWPRSATSRSCSSGSAVPARSPARCATSACPGSARRTARGRPPVPGRRHGRCRSTRSARTRSRSGSTPTTCACSRTTASRPSWQLDLPPDANDFDFAEILDVHLVLYYDGFFDPTLEPQVRAALPTTGGARGVLDGDVVPRRALLSGNQGGR